MSAHEYVGIDVAKAVLDVAVRPSGARWQVTNDEAGIVEVVAQLEALGAGLVVCEATGGFERAVVAALAVAGIPDPRSAAIPAIQRSRPSSVG